MSRPARGHQASTHCVPETGLSRREVRQAGHRGCRTRTQTVPLLIRHTASKEKIHSRWPLPASPPELHLPSNQILIRCFNHPQTTRTQKTCLPPNLSLVPKRLETTTIQYLVALTRALKREKEIKHPH